MIQIQGAINRAAQASLPVYKTTPVAALLRETKWGPVTAWLEEFNDRAVGRTEGLDKYKEWVESSEIGWKYGGGVLHYRGPYTEIASGKISLWRTVQIYDAELIGATEGLKAATNHILLKFATNVAVCLDNEEAAIRLHTGNLTPSNCKLNRLLIPVASSGTVIVKWNPGHAGISGNERVDYLAKIAYNEPTLRIKASISRAM
ncbi:hypothetical protein EPUL_004059, partial [Erysiphe pulchra]